MKIIEFKEKKFEIVEKISVLQFDRIMTLLKKFEDGEIGEIENTFKALKILLKDQSQVEEVNEILNGEMTPEIGEFMQKIAGILAPMIKSAVETKKKHKK